MSCAGEDEGPVRRVGERKNSRDHVFSVFPGRFLDPFCRSWRMRDCWRVRDTLGEGVRSEGSMGTMDASGRFIISRSSFVANAASRGPRLPTMDTCLTVERDKTSRTGPGTSYFDKTDGDVSSIRATSRATFPFPMSVTCESLSRGGGEGLDGCWVYQWTSDRAGMQWAEGGSSGWRIGRVQPVAKTR